MVVDASNAQNVGDRPRVIKSLYGEQGDLDEGMDVLSEHASPELLGVGNIALSDWGPHLSVGNRHQVLELNSVRGKARSCVDGVQKYSRVRERNHSSFGIFCDVVGPQEGS